MVLLFYTISEVYTIFGMVSGMYMIFYPFLPLPLFLIHLANSIPF